MDDNLKYIFDYYKSPKHCLVESSEIDNVCHGKMKKSIKHLDERLIIFPLYFTFYTVHISIDEYRTDGIPHIYLYIVSLSYWLPSPTSISNPVRALLFSLELLPV